MDSILNSVKEYNGIVPEYTHFDSIIMSLINSEFSKLTQLGCGPKEGYQITGPDESWTDYLISPEKLNYVRSYICIRVKLLFDPPTNSSILQALKESANEYEWRILVECGSEVNNSAGD